ncbi:MAG: hypothetical protein KF729_14275 [Sandaracinaceae bacterium]|nr:hypothetical protein [Sandaracinaceae bacterium]
MRRLAALLAALSGLAGCDSTPLARSCGGDEVELCGPREWAEVLEGSIEPERLPHGDRSATARVRVVIERCADSPAPHEVAIFALVPDGDGVGRVVNLATVADGEDGDATPGDGVIEVDVENPFGPPLPEDTTLTLRFAARTTGASRCSSGDLERPYRTGVTPEE